MPERRAKRQDGEARAALLDAAELLLGDRRIADLTVADVLARADVSRASFYFYFGSKYDLVIALAQQIMDEVEQASEPWLEPWRARARGGIAGGLARRAGGLARARCGPARGRRVLAREPRAG